MDKCVPNICIIGAGFSGICAAVQLQRKLNSANFTIFEIHSDVGGTWLVNTYPGCACDIQSHLYSYSFSPKSDWSKEFAGQAEILDYIKEVATEFNIYKYTKFRHQVKRLAWNEELLKWMIFVVNLETGVEDELIFDIVINGSGQLRIPEFPSEFENFQGPLVHSAQWNSSISLEGKTVGVIGSGATAIQLIPEIAPIVGKLLCYQRQPAWVIPSFQTTFTPMTKWAFANVPLLRSAYRASLFLWNDVRFTAFQYGTFFSAIANSVAVGLSKFHVKHQIKNKPALRKQLVPNYRFGCKRVGISNKYLKTLDLPHVKIISSKIVKVRDQSLTTEDGKEETIDVLILATGFRVHDYFDPMEIFGTNGVNILPKWQADGPTSYLGTTSSCMPNYFMLLGPGSDVNHNSGIFQIECQVQWIVNVIKEMIKRKAKSVAIKQTAEDEYMKQTLEDMKKTVYGNFDCGSYFADKRGVITILYPKSCTSFWNDTRSIDFTKFDFVS